jgi:hypothetical protein
MIEQARKNQNNPIELFRQVTSKYTPEQINNFYNQAEQMGISKDVINQMKNGINAK